MYFVRYNVFLGFFFHNYGAERGMHGTMLVNQSPLKRAFQLQLRQNASRGPKTWCYWRSADNALIRENPGRVWEMWNNSTTVGSQNCVTMFSTNSTNHFMD